MVEPDEEMLLHVLLDREKQHWENVFIITKRTYILFMSKMQDGFTFTRLLEGKFDTLYTSATAKKEV
jgi:hypothetical protein